MNSVLALSLSPRYQKGSSIACACTRVDSIVDAVHLIASSRCIKIHSDASGSQGTDQSFSAAYSRERATGKTWGTGKADITRNQGVRLDNDKKVTLRPLIPLLLCQRPDHAPLTSTVAGAKSSSPSPLQPASMSATIIKTMLQITHSDNHVFALPVAICRSL